jgi:hypothetical protein
MLADEGRWPALGSHRRRSGRDSNPRGRLTPPTRFPVALLQPLGHHSRSASQHRAGVPAGSPLCRFSRSERLFAATVACAAIGRSLSFPLAPGASRSRLKLRRGTEAFRGNGTPAEWTKRRASGHSFFGAERAAETARRGPCAFPAASGISLSRRLVPAASVPLLSVSHRTLSRKQTKLRRGVGSLSGPRHAGEAYEVTESRSVQLVFRRDAIGERS